MSAFITTTGINWALYPISQPELELLPETALVCGQFTLKVGEKAAFKLFLHYISNNTVGSLNKVSNGLPAVYAGIYLNFPANRQALPAPPAIFVGLDLPGVAAYDSTAELSTAGIYSIVLVNNASATTNNALLTGWALIKNSHA